MMFNRLVYLLIFIIKELVETTRRKRKCVLLSIHRLDKMSVTRTITIYWSEKEESLLEVRLLKSVENR